MTNCRHYFDQIPINVENNVEKCVVLLRCDVVSPKDRTNDLIIMSSAVAQYGIVGLGSAYH